MKQRTIEAINLLEQITAGRFYTDRGREALIEVIAHAMSLPAEDALSISEAQFSQYTTLQDVSNALLLMLGHQHGEVGEAVLATRKNVLNTQKPFPFRDKNAWLMFILHAPGDADELAQFEAGCFQCATRRYDAAFATLMPLAAGGNLNAMWLALGLANMQGKEAEETKLLSKLYGMFEQGILDEMPDELTARMEKLIAAGYEPDADFTMLRKIGF